MGRKAREVQPWSSAERAKATLVAEWGASEYRNVALKVTAAVARSVDIPLWANRIRALVNELGLLQRSAKKVRELVEAHPMFDPEPGNLELAALSARAETVDQYLKDARKVRDGAELVDVIARGLGQYESRLLGRLLPTEGYGDAVDLPTGKLLAAAKVVRGLSLKPRLTGTKAAWLSIALKLEAPISTADKEAAKEEFQNRRRAWDVRLKPKSPRQDTLGRLRGQPPEWVIEEERRQVVAEVDRLVGAGHLEEAMDLLGPALVRKVAEALRKRGDVAAEGWELAAVDAEERSASRERTISGAGGI